MKRQIFKMGLISFIVFSFFSTAYAVNSVNLTIRDGGTVIGPIVVPLQPAGTITLNGHSLDADSVLSVLNDADISSSDFSISNLQYDNTYSSFYVKCITDSIGNECDNWQYTVNGNYPNVGMDKDILAGGENVYVYFGPQSKIVLGSGNITTNDTLIVTAQNYDYQNNVWTTRTGATIGLTQPDPNNPWPPIEVKTGAVDTNGQAVFSSIPAGNYNVGIQPDYFPTETLTVTAPPVEHHSGGGFLASISNTTFTTNSPAAPVPLLPAENKSVVKTKSVFDKKKAFEFIISQQKSDGSFGEDLYTDWTTMALASTPDYQDQKAKLVKYLSENKLTGNLLTDYERRAMTLMALGLNPYNTNGENYIGKISAGFDGKQFGDINEDNDDIFALIVLQNAGYKQNEKMINDDINFILSRQKENGSWDESVDLTGAAIESLSAFSPTPGVRESLTKARGFLKQNQKDDGSWGNVSSTTWALEGIIGLNEKGEDWIKNDKTPFDYLATRQDLDGGIKNSNNTNKIWETAYAASILSGKNWNRIMQNFEKPKPVVVITKIPKKLIEKQENTATTINIVTNSSLPTQKETPKKNWFIKLLESIFSVF